MYVQREQTAQKSRTILRSGFKINAIYPDLIGKTIGNLEIISRAEPKNGITYLNCVCICGKKIVKSLPLLLTTISPSCGCTATYQNKYDLSGDHGVGYTIDETVKFYFDIEDYDLIKGIYWNRHHGRSSEADNYYITGCINGKKRYLHRYILNLQDEHIQIDHINQLKYDNRKSNLRTATHAQNQINRTVKSNNQTGFIGVYKTVDNRYCAQITINRQAIYLGRYISIEEAIIARLIAEKNFYGEFAPQAHLFCEYGI